MLRPIHLLALAVVGVASATAQAEPWSMKLGYPPGQRVIILEARELGIGWETNEASQKLLESGHLTSASAMATGPWFRDIAAWARLHPQYDLGLSIALTNPYDVLSWRLLTSETGPTTLVNADGNPWKSVVQLYVSAQTDDVRRELDAQLRSARSLGYTPSHLTGYYGTAFCRSDLCAVFLAAAQKYWIPAPVVELTPELVDRFRREGYPVDETMIRLVANYTLPKLDDLQIFPVGTTYDETRDNFCHLLTVLPPGLTQIVCHPATASEGMKRLTPDWQQRSWTAKALADPKVAQTMKEQQIILTTWRDIMHRFEQGTPLELHTLHKEEQANEKKLEAFERSEGEAPIDTTDSK